MLTAIAFMLFFSAGCVLAFVRHPIYGLLTYVSLIYLHPPTSWWSFAIPSFRWSLAASVLTLIAVLVHKKDDKSSKIFSSSLVKGMIVFVVWLALQSFWALSSVMHRELLVLTTKFTLLVVVIYRCLDSPKHLKYFLWSHAVGCFYLGTIVLTKYVGGRFEGFEGPGINEANAAALQIATGVIVTFALFLSGKWYEKIAAIGFMPITLNALVASISRSGFLALGVAGLFFNMFAPKKIAGTVRIFSVLGAVLFIAITNPTYWERISTILDSGQEIEHVSTGTGRIVLMKAQLTMFSEYPLGCGHRCTAVLSPAYLEDRFLTGSDGSRARSSHNTLMSLLVEQGIPGVILYFMMLVWIAKRAFGLREKMRNGNGLLPNTYAATIAILAAITIGDMFVDYLKFETRVWFLALLMVIVRMSAEEDIADSAAVEEPASRQRRLRATT